ncbi:MAG: outer-membrane lipoprotein carrier protein LolA [Desulfobulbus sp.]|nr:outer-membrane lipoprotein carrier protein LolA [Desulfobulbus sp.]
MYKHIRYVIVLILAVLFSLPALAATVLTPQQLKTSLDQLQTTYQQLHSLQFNFTQITDSAGRIKEGRGSASFYRSTTAGSANSGVMRWDYDEPAPQVILNNGRELSIYTPQDKQLIVTPIQDLDSDITYALFTGSKKLAEEFVVNAPDPVFYINDPPKEMLAIQLTPREPHPQIKRIQIWIDKRRTLQRLLMEDHFGALTELDFSQIRFNALPAKDAKQEQLLLQLNLAPGTEIIRQ